jgi:hypothetical protein
MVIPQQVKDSMDNEADDFSVEAMAIYSSLPLGGGDRDDDISKQAWRPPVERLDALSRQDLRWKADGVTTPMCTFVLERKG